MECHPPKLFYNLGEMAKNCPWESRDIQQRFVEGFLKNHTLSVANHDQGTAMVIGSPIMEHMTMICLLSFCQKNWKTVLYQPDPNDKHRILNLSKSIHVSMELIN